MGEIKVDSAAVSQVEGDIAKAQQFLNQQLEDLQAEVNRLAASWTGEAAEAYQQRQQQWNSATQDMNQILMQIKSALSTANADLMGTDHGNAKMWAG